MPACACSTKIVNSWIGVLCLQAASHSLQTSRFLQKQDSTLCQKLPNAIFAPATAVMSSADQLARFILPLCKALSMRCRLLRDPEQCGRAHDAHVSGRRGAAAARGAVGGRFWRRALALPQRLLLLLPGVCGPRGGARARGAQCSAGLEPAQELLKSGDRNLRRCEALSVVMSNRSISKIQSARVLLMFRYTSQVVM